MKNETGYLVFFAVATLVVSSCSTVTQAENKNPTQSSMKSEGKNSVTDVNTMTKDWPARPKLAVQEMMLQYGTPLELTSETVVWHNVGPYKRIMVTKKEVPHDFPKPHMDFLQHTISYNVPTDKVDDLVAYDASMTINKTAGEMSARCDLEGHNILTLNLARDIIQGKTSVAAARKSFGENAVADVMGKKPAYVEKLQFSPQSMEKATFADKPVIPGSPIRAETETGAKGSDAEVLAFAIAIDDNEVLAAATAQKKKISPKVMDYAKMLQSEHGKSQGKAMKLGQALKAVPKDTQAVDEFRVKGASKLAALVPFEGQDFEKAYLGAMVKGHTEVLGLIDDQLLKDADHASLKQYLTEKRKHVAMHLETAKNLQKQEAAK